jgi:hypothetical protein
VKVSGRVIEGYYSRKELSRLNQKRIEKFQRQVAVLRAAEADPENYHGATSGFLAEIDRMQLVVREYSSLHADRLRQLSLLVCALNESS